MGGTFKRAEMSWRECNLLRMTDRLHGPGLLKTAHVYYLALIVGEIEIKDMHIHFLITGALYVCHTIMENGTGASDNSKD